MLVGIDMGSRPFEWCSESRRVQLAERIRGVVLSNAAGVCVDSRRMRVSIFETGEREGAGRSIARR